MGANVDRSWLSLCEIGSGNGRIFVGRDGARDGRRRSCSLVGGVKLALDRQTRGRGILMIVAALVMVMNVMIWTV